jgi:hypothetical protein
MPEGFWIELAEENPLGANGITATDVKDWFYLRVWPRFKTYPYGRTTDEGLLVNLIARWWSHVDGQEILEARHLRKVRLGEAKPLMHRPRVGSKELPQEMRSVGEEQKMERLRLVRGG